MSRFLKLAITVMAGLSMWACVDNANTNKPANTNANVNSNSTASKAAPTVDALMAQEKQANEAYSKGDGQFFQGFLSDKFVMFEKGQRMDKAAVVKMISGVKCDVKSMTLDEPKMSTIDADNYAFVYKATWDGTCTFDGKTQPVPSPVRAATVWTRSGDKWQPVWHGETLIQDPKTAKPPAPSPAAESDKTASNTNSNTSAPATDANVEAIVAVEKAGWEAWKARDAAKLGGMTTSNLAFVGLFGNYTGSKDETIKSWTGGPCDIKSTNITDSSGQMISSTVGMISFKGTAEGTCDEMKLWPLWGTSFYVKEGDAWKLAFGFETPA